MANKIDWKNHLVELVVVFIGITAAFSLNSWQANRNKNNLERKYIASLAVDIKDDIVQLQELISAVETNVAHLQELDSLLTAGLLGQPEASKYNEAMFSLEQFVPQSVTFETLKSSGDMSLIEDFELRKQVNLLYAMYARLRTVETVKHHFVDTYVVPFFFEHAGFKHDGIEQSDYVRSPKFRNLASGCLASTLQEIEQYQNCLQNAEALLTRLQKE